MTAITFTLQGKPDQRLDLSGLTPNRLAGLSEAEIAVIPVGSRRQKLLAGEAFRITAGRTETVHIVGADGTFDRIGEGMTCGAIQVDGDAGAYAGRGMKGGALVVRGNAGPWAGTRMEGGRIDIHGNAGDFLGGAMPGEMQGLVNGVIIVRGDAGARAGDRMRRGLIVIEGRAGDYAGSRMIAGTLAAIGGAGNLPGYQLRRGTIILGGKVGEWTPTFVDCGPQDLTVAQLVARSIKGHGALATAERLAAGPVRRFAGDMAVLGKGEIWQVA
jgi:formylmethanofuran dehydrogenase subunit C